MRYFTWEEPYVFDTLVNKLPVHARFTASEFWIRDACSHAKDTRTHQQVLEDFIATNYAWETDEHGKELRRSKEEACYVYQVCTSSCSQE